jgi:hypothetical protein
MTYVSCVDLRLSVHPNLGRNVHGSLRSVQEQIRLARGVAFRRAVQYL